jgi:phosphoribosyl 1,2-cyclic phosphodiesterase
MLIHDAQHTASELPARASFGHAAAEYAVGLGAEAGVGRVVLFHHDPTRSDREVDEVVHRLQRPDRIVEAAAEGAHHQL